MDIQHPKRKSKLKQYIEAIKQSSFQNETQFPNSTSKKPKINSSSQPQFTHISDYSQRPPIIFPSTSESVSEIINQNLEYKNIIRGNSTSKRKINLEKEVSFFKKEIETLKQKTSKTKEKISIFIKLIRNYAKKLQAFCSLINNNNINVKNSVYIGLTNTINQFYNMIYNQKINDSIFDSSGFVIEDNNNINDIDNNNIQINESIMNHKKELINNLENTIKKLNDDNKQLCHEKEECLIQMQNIESHNQQLLNEIHSKKQEIETLTLLNNNLQSELKTKDNIIFYLENKSQNQPQFINNNNNNIHNNTNEDIVNHNNLNISNDDNRNVEEEEENLKNEIINDEHTNIDEYINSNNNNNNINTIPNEYHINTESNNDNTNIRDTSYSQRPKKIKQEIDVLDQEIVELRKQLQSMLKRK